MRNLCVALIAFAVALVVAAQNAPPPPRAAAPGPPERPQRIVQVGPVTYSGQHTWRGVIEVGSDDIIFEDGRITTGPASAGLPQGVSFNGNRRNITLRNLTFEGVGDGINIGNDQAVDDLTIDNCRFLGCRTPDVKSDDVLRGSRGYGIFGAKGHNWTIRSSAFQTKCQPEPPQDSAAVDFSIQYAMRLGAVHGLNVSDSRFENHNGKPVVWLMFVHDAVFDNAQFVGGRFLVGCRPGDMGGIEKGDCRNITFRNCTFTFGRFEDWPASINMYPGAQKVRFENCTFQTEGDWWLEIDSRNVRDVRWDKITWNGKLVEGYTGVRSSISEQEMAAKDVGPLR